MQLFKPVCCSRGDGGSKSGFLLCVAWGGVSEREGTTLLLVEELFAVVQDALPEEVEIYLKVTKRLNELIKKEI